MWLRKSNIQTVLQISWIRNLNCLCFLIRRNIKFMGKCSYYIALTLNHNYCQHLSLYTKGQTCWVNSSSLNAKIEKEDKKKPIRTPVEVNIFIRVMEYCQWYRYRTYLQFVHKHRLKWTVFTRLSVYMHMFTN